MVQPDSESIYKPANNMMSSQLLSHLNHHLTQAQDVPLLSLPENLLKLRKASNTLSSDIFTIEEEVVKDTGFSAYLLKVANSALYGMGRSECSNVASAIRRIGLHAVGQMAMVYALRGLHQIKEAPPLILKLMNENWQLSALLMQQSTSLYWQQRQLGREDVRRLDISDIMTNAILYYAGSLACYSQAALLYRDGHQFDEETIQQVASSMQLAVLNQLLASWGYETETVTAMTLGVKDDAPLHFSDFVHAARVRNHLEPGESPALLKRLIAKGLLEENVLASTQ